MRAMTLLLVALALTTSGCFNGVEGPVIEMTASYPGANAQVVADTIAAPIEQQVNGVEGMLRLESESRNDGSYIANVQFETGTDPNLAMTLVQNRVALAEAALPETVRRAGVTVKRGIGQNRPRHVAIAIIDRGNHGRDVLRRLSEAVLKRLSANGAIMKPDVFPRLDEREVIVRPDRAKCAKLGVSIAEVIKALQATNSSKKVDELKMLPVRSEKGDAVPLGTLVRFDLASCPSGVYRIDLYPAIRLTGSPPTGKTAESAASRCEELANAELRSQNCSADVAVMNLIAR
jgi:multidrug efflux pump subunit AcrB